MTQRRASPGPYKMLAVDLDGTLLDTRGQPHACDVAAVRALAARGVEVTIVTGRLYSGTRPTAEVLALLGPVACADGSHVVHARDHATLLHHGIAGEHAEGLRACVAAAGVASFVFAKDRIVHDERGARFLGYLTTWSTDVLGCARVHEHEAWGDEDGVTGVVSVGEAAPITEAAQAIRGALGSAAQVATFPIRKIEGHWGMIVRASAGTKATAVEWIARHHGFDIEEVVCVGDWFNDLPMLAHAGRSFAMGQAPDEVKAVATDLLEETSETGGGVARAIERAFGLRLP